MRKPTAWFFAATMLLAQLAATASRAQTNPPYIPINPPETVTATDKVEVVEVFSYGCIHCAQFQQHVDAWRKRLNASKVGFVYLPAPYSPQYAALARGYYAAESLGVAEKTHQAVFEAIHLHGAVVRNFDDVVALYRRLGVASSDFVKAARDFYVDKEVRRANELMTKYKIDSTPTLIVAGKYRITVDTAGGYDAMIKAADSLIAQELAQKTSTSRQAPTSVKSGK